MSDIRLPVDAKPTPPVAVQAAKPVASSSGLIEEALSAAAWAPSAVHNVYVSAGSGQIGSTGIQWVAHAARKSPKEPYAFRLVKLGTGSENLGSDFVTGEKAARLADKIGLDD